MPTEHPVDDWIARRCQGVPMRVMAEESGLTISRVMQLTREYAPHEPWRAIKREARTLREEVDRYKVYGRCLICNAWMFAKDHHENPRYKTCSDEHQKLYRALQYVIDEEKRDQHRLALAKVAEERGDPLGPVQQALLRGEHPSKARTHVYEGSRVWRALEAMLEHDSPLLDEVEPGVIEYYLEKTSDA